MIYPRPKKYTIFEKQINNKKIFSNLNNDEERLFKQVLEPFFSKDGINLLTENVTFNHNEEYEIDLYTRKPNTKYKK